MSQATDQRERARLRLIGRFRLEGGDGAPVELPSRRARALLAYLALAPERSASRERLSGLLWSDRGEPQARASLRQCLLELRGALTARGLDLLRVGRASVALASENIDVDIDRLRDALDAGPDAVTERLSALSVHGLLDDLEIGGLFEDWRNQARARLDRSIATAVETQLAALEARSEWTKARALAEAWLQRDPLDESAVAAAIRCDMALGATAAAHRRFQLFEAALAKELGVEPGRAVRAALTPSGSASTLHSDALPPTVGRAPLALPDRPSIAVAPFKNLSGDPEQEYFADAITEDIVTALSCWRWFFVIASGSSGTYKNQDVPADQFGRELGVRYVLRGSVRKAGTRVRISAQLIDTQDNAHLWAERFDRDLVDVLDLQDELTSLVVAAIEPAILNVEGVRAASKSLKDYSALDCYYRGVWHLNRVSEVGYKESLALFREAILRDPDLVLGSVGLSRILWGGAVFGWTSDPIASLEEAQAAAREAISLNANEATAFFASAGASLYLGDHAAALNAGRRAVTINPNFALASLRLGHILVFAGHPDEAIEPIERGLRLSPTDPQLGINLNLLSVAYYQARRYEDALAPARAAMDLGKERSSYVLAASLARLGRLTEAAAVLPRTDERSNSVQRPLAPRYADSAHWRHWKDGVQLAIDSRAKRDG